MLVEITESVFVNSENVTGLDVVPINDRYDSVNDVFRVVVHHTDFGAGGKVSKTTHCEIHDMETDQSEMRDLAARINRANLGEL